MCPFWDKMSPKEPSPMGHWDRREKVDLTKNKDDNTAELLKMIEIGRAHV